MDCCLAKIVSLKKKSKKNYMRRRWLSTCACIFGGNKGDNTDRRCPIVYKILSNSRDISKKKQGTKFSTYGAYLLSRKKKTIWHITEKH
jgi:hypothetical protein